jgi:hypothetical protein
MSMAPQELPNAHKHGKGEGSQVGYFLEVRSSYMTPTVIDAKTVIDNVWRRWDIREGTTPYGLNVPLGRSDREMLQHGLMSYEAAQAHRWGLIAALEAQSLLGALCIETRLVKVQFHYTYRLEEIGVEEAEKATFLRRSQGVKPRSPEAEEAAKTDEQPDNSRIAERSRAIRKRLSEADGDRPEGMDQG